MWNINVRSANDRGDLCDGTTVLKYGNVELLPCQIWIKAWSPVFGEKIPFCESLRVARRRDLKGHRAKYNGRCGMRRLARRRNILAAFFAIMGRLGKGSQSATRPIFRVHYRKLVDEYSQQEQLRFMPALPDYMSYCCCRCGHTQKFKVSLIWN